MSRYEPRSALDDVDAKDCFFCISPWTMAYAHDNGKYAPCNFASVHPSMDVMNTSVNDWMTSDVMNKLRAEMIDPNSDHETINKYCSKCKFDEKRYGTSRRLHTAWKAGDKEYWEQIKRSVALTRAAGEYWFDERILEMQLRTFGSQCNLDCYMCHHFSSTIRQQMAYDKGVWNSTVWGGIKGSKTLSAVANLDKVESNNLVDQMIELAPYTRTLKIIGGEPLVMKQYYQLLDRLIEEDQAKHINLKYQTNLTKLKNGRHNFLDYIPEFADVVITVSIDAVGKYNDYIRRRSNFEEIEQNIELCSKYDNVVINVNSTLSVPGVLRFHEVADWANNNQHVTGQSYWLIKDPAQMRVNNLPEPLKERLIPYYQDKPDYADILAALRLPAESDANFDELCNYLKRGDEAYRGTKWEMELFDVFPELEEYYGIQS